MLSPGSVADVFGLGVEVQLSTVVHHSGAWIEYDYEQSTGHLVAMRRSDGTVLELKWHNRISRLLSIWVKNEETHPGEEPFRLASYNYDGKGRLLKVINSAAGQCDTTMMTSIGLPGGRIGMGTPTITDSTTRVGLLPRWGPGACSPTLPCGSQTLVMTPQKTAWFASR